MNLNNSEQEIPEVQLEEYALKLMQVILQADQRPKQNHKDAILQAHPQELFPFGRELGLMLKQGNIHSPITSRQ